MSFPKPNPPNQPPTSPARRVAVSALLAAPISKEEVMPHDSKTPAI